MSESGFSGWEDSQDKKGYKIEVVVLSAFRRQKEDG